MTLRVLELFAGIGACSKALEELGIDFEIVDAVEIDKYAIKSFNAIHNTNFESQDIKDWDKDIECDLIIHGSPCQDFSIAGLGAGGNEGSNTRSSLLYESIRIIEKLQPKYVIWENVKNMLSKKHCQNWYAYAKKLEELGYVNYCEVLNAKNYGIPQNRERVFTISIKKPILKSFEFPQSIPLEKRLKDILEKDVDKKYYLSNAKLKMVKFENTTANIYSIPKVIGGIGKKDSNGGTQWKLQNRIYANQVATSLVTSSFRPYYMTQETSLIIRRLTPKESWRLMGFSDEDYEKASKVCSATQLYKQAGNSIVVDVLKAILKNLM